MATLVSKPIVVVDDEESICNLVKRFVENTGYPAIVCKSAFEALAATRSVTPALIISDFNLPGTLDGVDLCLEIRRESEEEIPVIIISGETTNEMKAREQGFRFVGKPLSRSYLMSLVESCLQAA